MATSIGEKFGVILTFIPGVSTIVGIVKAINYHSRLGQNNEALLLAEKMQYASMPLLCRDLLECNEKLFKVSLIGMIPGVNIVAAIVESVYLHRLSRINNELRELQIQYENASLADFQDRPLISRVLATLDKKKNFKMLAYGLPIGKDVHAIKLIVAKDAVSYCERHPNEKPMDILQKLFYRVGYTIWYDNKPGLTCYNRELADKRLEEYFIHFIRAESQT